MCEFKKNDEVICWDKNKNYEHKEKGLFYAYDSTLECPYLIIDTGGTITNFQCCKKANPKIAPNTKVLVWDWSTKNKKVKRYATGCFDEHGKIEAWMNGADEWSNDGVTTVWENYEIAK